MVSFLHYPAPEDSLRPPSHDSTTSFPSTPRFDCFSGSSLGYSQLSHPNPSSLGSTLRGDFDDEDETEEEQYGESCAQGDDIHHMTREGEEVEEEARLLYSSGLTEETIETEGIDVLLHPSISWKHSRHLMWESLKSEFRWSRRGFDLVGRDWRQIFSQSSFKSLSPTIYMLLRLGFAVWCVLHVLFFVFYWYVQSGIGNLWLAEFANWTFIFSTLYFVCSVRIHIIALCQWHHEKKKMDSNDIDPILVAFQPAVAIPSDSPDDVGDGSSWSSVSSSTRSSSCGNKRSGGTILSKQWQDYQSSESPYLYNKKRASTPLSVEIVWLLYLTVLPTTLVSTLVYCITFRSSASSSFTSAAMPPVNGDFLSLSHRLSVGSESFFRYSSVIIHLVAPLLILVEWVLNRIPYFLSQSVYACTFMLVFVLYSFIHSRLNLYNPFCHSFGFVIHPVLRYDDDPAAAAMILSIVFGIIYPMLNGLIWLTVGRRNVFVDPPHGPGHCSRCKAATVKS